jgi:phenylacetate-CoA ligase
LVACDGSQITWTALNVHDDTFDHVLRFQLYQDTPGQAVLRLVPGKGFGESDRERIQRNLGRKLNGRLVLTLEVTESIPLSARGKAIYVDQRIPGLGGGNGEGTSSAPAVARVGTADAPPVATERGVPRGPFA